MVGDRPARQVQQKVPERQRRCLSLLLAEVLHDPRLDLPRRPLWTQSSEVRDRPAVEGSAALPLVLRPKLALCDASGRKNNELGLELDRIARTLGTKRWVRPTNPGWWLDGLMGAR